MWVVCDIGGVVCVAFTYGLVFGISAIVTKVSILPLAEAGAINEIACLLSYYLIISLCLLCHLKCMLTDPGSIPNVLLPRVPVCPKCSAPKPHRVHHCSTCNKCILKMDHHCPWMNNCIGFNNQKHFILFLAYAEIACIYSIALLVIRAAFCQIEKNSKLCKASSENSVNVLLGILGLMLLGLFFLFIAVMIHDQIKGIANNTTGIESLKKEIVEEREKMLNFEEVFGGKIGVKWFFPIGIPEGIENYLSKFIEI